MSQERLKAELNPSEAMIWPPPHLLHEVVRKGVNLSAHTCQQ